MRTLAQIARAAKLPGRARAGDAARVEAKLRRTLQALERREARKAQAAHAAGRGTRKIKAGGASKRAGSSAYRPASGVCYDGSGFALLVELGLV